MITIKLNRFTSYLQQLQQQPQSPSPPPSDYFNIILNFIPDSFAALFDKFNDIFPPGCWDEWLSTAAHWLAYVVGGAVLLSLLCVCLLEGLPVIFSCIISVFIAIFNLLKGFFMLLCNAFNTDSRNEVYFPRAGFESHLVAAFFEGVRARLTRGESNFRNHVIFRTTIDIESNPATAYFQGERATFARSDSGESDI